MRKNIGTCYLYKSNRNICKKKLVISQKLIWQGTLKKNPYQGCDYDKKTKGKTGVAGGQFFFRGLK